MYNLLFALERYSEGEWQPVGYLKDRKAATDLEVALDGEASLYRVATYQPTSLYTMVDTCRG